MKKLLNISIRQPLSIMNPLQVVVVPPKTILLVIAEPTVREVMQDCLSYLGGWQITVTSSLAEGLQSAKHSPPDAIVLDHSTSDLDDHILFLTALRAQVATQTTPVVLMTVSLKWLDFQCFQQFNVAGAIDYSLETSKLPAAIATLLDWSEE
jgi:CheY-like chemotaxis protein